MDEIKLFGELKPPPPPDAPRMREAARARLTAATSAPPAHPARRRGAVVSVAVAAALVAAGTGYGLTTAQGGSSSPNTARTGSGSLTSTTAGLAAVHGCPGKYLVAGTLKQVSGTQLTVQPFHNPFKPRTGRKPQPVIVTTSASTVITRLVTGTVSDITDGSHAFVQGTWSGGRLAAAKVGINTALSTLPIPAALPKVRHPRGHLPSGVLGPLAVNGTVADAHNGSFTVILRHPSPGWRTRIHVITSSSTKVLTRTSIGLSQLHPGGGVVAIGQIRPHRVLAAGTVAVPSPAKVAIVGGPVELYPLGCSESAMTTAAVLASG